MKKLSYYLLTALAAVQMLSGCDIAQFSGPDEGYGVYFPEQDASGIHYFYPEDSTARIITVCAMRTDTVGAITVPVELTVSEDGIFTVQELSFPDGADSTSFDVNVGGIQKDVEYSLKIKIADNEYASHKAQNATSIDMRVKISEWKKFFGPEATDSTSKGRFTQVAWEEAYDCDMYYRNSKYRDIRECKIENGWRGNKQTVDMVFYWDTKTNNCFVPQQWMGYITTASAYVYSGGACDFYNSYYKWDYVCPSKEYFEWAPKWLAKNGFRQPYYDGNGGFYLGDWTYSGSAAGAPTGSGWQFGADYVVEMDLFVAAGFDRREFQVKSIKSDYTVDGKIPVTIQVGQTTKAIKYATVKGSLSEASAASVIKDIIDGKAGTIVTEFAKGEDEEKRPIVSTSLQLEFNETADYSIVVVTFADEACSAAEAKANGYQNFFFVAKGDMDKYAVSLTVGTEHTPAGDSVNNKYNSFQTYVTGTGITKACVYVISTKEYNAQTDAYNAYIKSGCPDSKNNTYYVTDSVLTEINKAGGYCTIVGGRSCLTSYTVIVWATNDALDIIKTAEYTTDGQYLGTGTYTFNGYYKTTENYEFYRDPNYTNKYLLKDWPVTNGQFYFTWDGKTNVKVNYTNSLQTTFNSYGEVFCKEDVLVSATPQLAASSYVDSTRTFTFNLAFYVGAGILTRGSETFVWTPGEKPTQASRTMKSERSSVKPVFNGTPAPASGLKPGNIPEQFNFNKCRQVVRIPQTVECKATVDTRVMRATRPAAKSAAKSAVKPAEKPANIKPLR